MREIKFRVWNGTGKRMLYDSSLAFKGNKVIEEIGTKVMQYTGLKDKNGKEIYEGDVIEGRQKIPIIVKWLQFGAEYNISMEANDWQIVEVIGNIYENPKLINRGK